MDDSQAARQQQAEELVRREIERKSRDIIRVYNPLDTPFRYMFDGRWHSVPAQGTKDIERWLANHYFKKISEFMIGQQMLESGEKLLQRRKKQGLPDFLNKYDENKAIWDNTPHQNDPTLLEEIAATVILGLVEEFGLDLPDGPLESSIQGDTRTIQDQIFAKFDKRLAPLDEELKPLKKDLEDITND